MNYVRERYSNFCPYGFVNHECSFGTSSILQELTGRVFSLVSNIYLALFQWKILSQAKE